MSTRIKLNSKAVRDLLRSSEMVADLDARARRIEQAAGPGHKSEAQAGRSRALASVWTVTRQAKEDEARSRSLTRAIDAGR